MFNPNASGVGARRFVEFAQHGGNDMRSLEIEVVLGPYRFVGIAEMNWQPNCWRYAWQESGPAILAMA